MLIPSNIIYYDHCLYNFRICGPLQKNQARTELEASSLLASPQGARRFYASYWKIIVINNLT